LLLCSANSNLVSPATASARTIIVISSSMAGQLANLTGTRVLKKATSTRRISDSLAETLKSLCDFLALPCQVSWHSRWPKRTVCLSKEALPEADELTAKPRRTSPPPAASLPPACRHTPKTTVRIVCQRGAEDSLSVGSPQRTVGSVPKHRRHQKIMPASLAAACRRPAAACRWPAAARQRPPCEWLVKAVPKTACQLAAP
jgi:hypothetical protein